MDATNKQEVFNAVVAHFLAMDGPAMQCENGDTFCMYRDTERNRKCFAGALIPDADFDINFENTSAATTDHGAGQYLHEKGFDNGFVRDLQMCHDHAFLMDLRADERGDNFKWKVNAKKRLQSLAFANNLDASALN